MNVCLARFLNHVPITQNYKKKKKKKELKIVKTENTF